MGGSGRVVRAPAVAAVFVPLVGSVTFPLLTNELCDLDKAPPRSRPQFLFWNMRMQVPPSLGSCGN